MVLDDRLIERIDAEAMEKVLRPEGRRRAESRGGSGRHGPRLRPALLFCHYPVRQSGPIQLCGRQRLRRRDGASYARSRHPGSGVAWGGIEDAGYLARNMASDTTLKRRFAGNLISARTALNALDAAVDGPMAMTGSCAIARVDWAMAKRELAALRAPLFSSIATDGRHGSRPKRPRCSKGSRGGPSRRSSTPWPTSWSRRSRACCACPQGGRSAPARWRKSAWIRS